MKNNHTFKCLFNLDMGAIPMHVLPLPQKTDDLNKEFIQFYVNEVAGSDVDAFMCCPTYLRLPL